MKLRLFALRSTYTNNQLDGYFASKVEAKAERDKLNEGSPGRFVVVLGPDHFRFKR